MLLVRLLLLLTVFVAVAVPARADAKPVVLTLHPGGYYLYDASMMAAVDASFEAQGFKAVAVDYTKGDIEAGWRDVKAAAGDYPRRRVYAYGESAGGGFAAMLAAKGLIDGAVVLSPLIDLRPWGRDYGDRFNCTTRTCWQRYSPSRMPARAPVLEYVPTDDAFVDPSAALVWARRQPLVTAESWPGWHMCPSPKGREADLRRAGRFLSRLR